MRIAASPTILLTAVSSMFVAGACGGEGATNAIRAFGVSSDCIPAGSEVTLSWDVVRPGDCRLDATPTGRLDARKGDIAVTPTATTTFTLSCGDGLEAEQLSARVHVDAGDAARQVNFTARYERVPSTTDGLDYDNIEILPVRGAEYEILAGCDRISVASGALSAEGRGQSIYTGSNVVAIRVFSESRLPPIEVVDNTSGGAVYALEKEAFDLAATNVVELLAATGWGSSDYETVRAAGPFAILDSAFAAAEAFLAVTTLTFPPLTLNWSVRNRPEPGDPLSGFADGAIGTSFWDGGQLYILGQADVDSDEFDTHVIVHEWGHYFESSFSRADTVGGPHGFGELLDPRVAFSEGWGNALSAIVLAPKTIYTDSFGMNQAQASAFDLDDNTESIDPLPGWFSESSVQAILFDLVDDGTDEIWDDVSLGLLPIYQVLSGAQLETSAFTTVFSFVHGLKQLPAVDADAVDLLLNRHVIGEVVDEWGSGETNAGPSAADIGGIAANLPVYRDLAFGGATTLTFAGGEFAADGNKLGQHRYIRLTGTGGTMRLTAESDADVGMTLYRDGAIVGEADLTLRGRELLNFSSQNGAIYVVDVTGYRTSAGQYTATIELD